MSVYISSAVWRNSKASGPALLVLLSLADQCNDEGECWPKIDAIAARCRIGRRSLFRYLNELESLGELERVDRHAQRLANVYRVKLVPDWHQASATADTGLVPPLAPQEPSLEPSLKTDTSDPHFEEFWRVYPRHIGRAAAERKWASVTRRVAASVIVAGAERYAQHMAAAGTAVEFIAHPTTWLNQGRWDDELPEASQGQAGGAWW